MRLINKIIFLLLLLTFNVNADISKDIGISIQDINKSKYVQFVYEDLKKSWTKLRKKSDMYDKECDNNIITDFDFSNPVFDGIDLEKWMMYYDLKNSYKYVFEENKDFAYHVVLFEEAEHSYSIKDYNRTDLFKIYINTPELKFNTQKQLDELPKEARKYLEDKLSKPFNRKKLKIKLEAERELRLKK